MLPAPREERSATLEALSLPTADRILTAVERAVGGREKLIEALLACPPDSSLDYVVGLIADPRNDARKLSALCREGRITLGELLEAFKRGTLAPAVAQAIATVAARLPEIVEDVVTRSTVHDVPCPDCRGTSTTTASAGPDGAPTACPACHGTGVITRDPEFDRQKFVLTELAGLGRKPSPTPAVVIDQRDQRQQMIDVSGEAHKRLLMATDQLLFGRPRGPDGDLRTRTEAGSSIAPPAEDGYTPARDVTALDEE